MIPPSCPIPSFMTQFNAPAVAAVAVAAPAVAVVVVVAVTMNMVESNICVDMTIEALPAIAAMKL